jgi:serine/threonine protein kinase
MSNFERIRRLGGGYFGDVWLEHDNALDRLCAAKYISRADHFSDLDVFSEAQAMVLAEHQHVVKIYSADIADDIPVIRMEYLPNGSVYDKYGDSATSVAVALSIIEDTCRGLEFLHSRQWLHRDIKPANLMLSAVNRVKISDFGLSCSKDQTAKAPVGYIAHLPPESIGTSGYIESVAGDIYATGVTLYRLLNGSSVLGELTSDTSQDITSLIERGKFPPRDKFLPHIHDQLRRVVRKALHQDPDRRYRSASDLRHALERSRPQVSWQWREEADKECWEGESYDGSTIWRAQITSSQLGHYLFRLERRKPDGAFRSRTADSGKFSLRSEVLRHATLTLGRIAAEGN